MKYTIDIDERAVLVEVKQYDKDGEEVSVSAITVPLTPANSDEEQK